MSDLGAEGGRAVAVLCLMPRTAPGVSAESLSAQTRLCRTQALGTAPVLPMSCSKSELWNMGDSQDPQKSQARNLHWVNVGASLHPCLLALESR